MTLNLSDASVQSMAGLSFHDSSAGSMDGMVATQSPPKAALTTAGAAASTTAASTSAAGPRMPALPQIGLDEHVYARMARDADHRGDRHAREAAKVALYIPLAANPRIGWPEKLRHYLHAINQHCHVEPKADPRVRVFYHSLAHLVKEHCGAEALRVASQQDDVYVARLSIGIVRADIAREARRFFDDLIGDGKACPEHMLQEDFTMIRMVRDQWC